MNKKIYFLGSRDLRNELEKSLELIGWRIEDFIGWHVKDFIIYQLEKVDVPSFHIPDNLLILTSNIMLKDTDKPNIFYYQMNNLKFSFPKFIIKQLQVQKNKPSDFYDTREPVNLLYDYLTKDLETLISLLNMNRKYVIRKLKFSHSLTEQPIKTLIYIETPEKPKKMSTKIMTIYKGFNTAQKKELKGLNPLVPKLFINKINKSTSRKILKQLV